ncbi:tRNA-uridine aminocarboxypropyltransferase [Thalassotalea euphylliae]|uniref:tRNA-uridine aminocarboxypropyltransferase n=1 Tax=Thalassotalea euphylliae TaxID=1655234 RepID=A0A3E0UI04_9GAMM|nr:tRNA-uridine aminocarboxypropyltransferase [Thalassotalea euphylliae]REL35392.1 DTW domain-containing protein [Thalassotalea euphylliae]
MARATCDNCQRPPARCICQYVAKVNNQAEVVILQHPKEVDHPKGSADLLLTSLSNSRRFVGENFDEHADFQAFLRGMLNEEGKESNDNNENNVHNLVRKKLYVMFPGEHSSEVSAKVIAQPEETILIVIDGTWKKAYKMFQLSACLHQLPQLHLPSGLASCYDIRKTQKENALSTLEASCYALGILEQNTENYASLLENFAQYNQHQLSFRKSAR